MVFTAFFAIIFLTVVQGNDFEDTPFCPCPVVTEPGGNQIGELPCDTCFTLYTDPELWLFVESENRTYIKIVSPATDGGPAFISAACAEQSCSTETQPELQFQVGDPFKFCCDSGIRNAKQNPNINCANAATAKNLGGKCKAKFITCCDCCKSGQQNVAGRTCANRANTLAGDCKRAFLECCVDNPAGP